MRIILASKSPRRLELLSMTGLPFEVITSHVDEDKVEASVLQKCEEEGIRNRMYLVAEKVSLAQAQAKAEAVMESVSAAAESANSAMVSVSAAAEGVSWENDPADGIIIIGSDTVVVTEDEILGKPADEADARRMLTKLSGKTHRVYTGVAILKKNIGDGRNGCSSDDMSNREDATICCNDGIKSCVFSAFADVKFHELDSIQKEEIERYIATGSPMDKAGAYGIQDEGALLIDSISGDYYAVVGLPIARVSRELRALL
ncbi:MAG: septum formation protein Maf [Clostridiales bacterium]|nr:septum formation protein Maf [Clostridiales bacterium]